MSEQVEHNREEALRWFEQAEDNLAWARWSAQGQCWPPACFQCQQSGEMALKALLLFQGLRQRTHGILKMTELMIPFYPEVSSLLPFARQLDRYYIQSRTRTVLPRDALRITSRKAISSWPTRRLNRFVTWWPAY